MSDYRNINPYDDIAGLQEVAVELGVTLHCVRRWVERRPETSAPMPIKKLRGGNIYSLTEWRAWYAMWIKTHRRHKNYRRNPYG